MSVWKRQLLRVPEIAGCVNVEQRMNGGGAKRVSSGAITTASGDDVATSASTGTTTSKVQTSAFPESFILWSPFWRFTTSSSSGIVSDSISDSQYIRIVDSVPTAIMCDFVPLPIICFQCGTYVPSIPQVQDSCLSTKTEIRILAIAKSSGLRLDSSSLSEWR
jgi:hypothetical protein